MAQRRNHKPRVKKCTATGKIGYRNWIDAEIKRGNSESWHNVTTRVYQCEFCHKYHLTTQPLKEGR